MKVAQTRWSVALGLSLLAVASLAAGGDEPTPSPSPGAECPPCRVAAGPADASSFVVERFVSGRWEDTGLRPEPSEADGSRAWKFKFPAGRRDRFYRIRADGITPFVYDCPLPKIPSPVVLLCVPDAALPGGRYAPGDPIPFEIPERLRLNARLSLERFDLSGRWKKQGSNARLLRDAPGQAALTAPTRAGIYRLTIKAAGGVQASSVFEVAVRP